MKKALYILSVIYGILELAVLKASQKIQKLQNVFLLLQFTPLLLGGIYALVTRQGSVYTEADKNLWTVLFYDMVVGNPVHIKTKEANVAMIHGTYDGFLLHNTPIAFQDIVKYYPEGKYVLASCAAKARENIITKTHSFVNDPWSMRGETCCYTPLNKEGSKFIIWSSICYDLQRNFYLGYLIDPENFSTWKMFKYNLSIIFG